MPFQQSDAIKIKQIKGKGRGVFARRAISKGEVIESVPMLIMTPQEYEEGLSKTLLQHYCFNWGTDKVGLALGYGSLYNHSYRPNARYEDIGTQTKDFVALRDIAEGEEITINYNGKPESKAKVGFAVVETHSNPERVNRGETV